MSSIEGLPLDDERWSTLDGGYRIKYDPRPALARLGDGDESAWDELWNELHHQGDVGLASYAAVPHLVKIHSGRSIPDWQMYSLIGVIEVCRTQGRNPPLPAWLEKHYLKAWECVVELGCRDLPRAVDETAVRSILGAIALAKGLRSLGDIILDFTGDELAEMVEAQRGRDK
jgi:hypothetical protein